jgi:hypothetical protein
LNASSEPVGLVAALAADVPGAVPGGLIASTTGISAFSGVFAPVTWILACATTLALLVSDGALTCDPRSTQARGWP